MDHLPPDLHNIIQEYLQPLIRTRGDLSFRFLKGEMVNAISSCDDIKSGRWIVLQSPYTYEYDSTCFSIILHHEHTSPQPLPFALYNSQEGFDCNSVVICSRDQPLLHIGFPACAIVIVAYSNNIITLMMKRSGRKEEMAHHGILSYILTLMEGKPLTVHVFNRIVETDPILHLYRDVMAFLEDKDITSTSRVIINGLGDYTIL